MQEARFWCGRQSRHLREINGTSFPTAPVSLIILNVAKDKGHEMDVN